MKTRFSLSLALALGPLCFLASAEGPTLRGPDATEYLKQKGTYNSLNAAVNAAMYGAQTEPLGFAAPNGRHDFVAHFSKAGLQIAGMGWQSSWRLQSVGYSERQAGVRPALLNADGTRVELRRGPDVTEWYVNGARGLEQGFTLQRPLLTPRAGELLRLTMQVAGDLEARVSSDEIELVRADGAVELRYRHLIVKDAKGRELPARMGVADHQVWIEVNDAGAAWPVTVDPTFVLQAYVKASNTQANDLFGSAVAISGDTVVVGAYWEDNQILGEVTVFLENSGAAFVFVRSGTTWSQQARLKASNRGTGDHFGWSVALDGNTLVVGANQEDSSTVGVNTSPNENAMNSGAAYVFVRSGTTWSQQAYLKASNTGASDYFGQSVTVSGDTVVVGAPLEDSDSDTNQASNSKPDSGAAYVFVRNGTTWSQQAYVKSGSDNSPSSQFGLMVSLSGDTLAVGWPYFANGPYVIVLQRFGSTWSRTAFINGSFTFLSSVAISGDTIVAGNHMLTLDDQGLAKWESGSAHVYIRNGFNWSLQQTLLPSNGEAGDWFGITVAISGETLVVGAIHEDSGGNFFPDSGAAYVFTRNGTLWSQQDYLKSIVGSAGDLFGLGIAVSGNTLVVGAQGEDSSSVGVGGNQTNNNAVDSGAAYIFFLEGPACTYTLSASSQNIGSGGGSGSVGVTAPVGCAWTAVSNNLSFLTVTSGSSGSGNGTVNFTVTANASASPRNGTLTIGGQTFTVIQAGAVSCSYTLSASSQNVAAGGGTGSVGVTAPVGCGWTAVSNNLAILTVTSGSPGSGNGTVSFLVASNPAGAVRSGTLTIAGQTFTVNQSGAIIITDIRSITDFGDVPNFTSGSWLQIKGQNLAAATRIWLDSDFNGDNSPTMLDGVSVTFNGTLGIMYFTKPDDGDGPSQINVLAPGGLANGPVQIVVTNPQGVSNTYTLQKTALAPGMLSPPKFNVGGRQYLVATYGSNYFFVGNENLLPGAPFLPAKPGDILYAYGVGFGDTTPFFAQGVVPRVLAPLNAQVKFQFGPVLVTPYYAGYYPNFIGLDLFGLVVPNVPDGDHLITVLVNGQPLAQTLYLTVRR